MSAAADEHRLVAGAFTTTVEGVPADRWDDPAPVQGWTARDVVGHLVEWFPSFLENATDVTLPAGPSVADDPVGAWRTQTVSVQALLEAIWEFYFSEDPAASGNWLLGSLD